MGFLLMRSSRILSTTTSRILSRRYFADLTRPLPNLVFKVKDSAKSSPHSAPSTVVTKHGSGLTVASQNATGSLCTVGVVISSGSRFEVNHLGGISHFIEKLAFSSTSEYSSKDVISQILEKHGGVFDCQGTRDISCYAMSADGENGLETLIHVLSQVIFHPKFLDHEIEDTRNAIKNELDTMKILPDQDPFLLEMIHSAAYKDNTLGLPKICPVENVSKITRNHIYNYLNNIYTPERIVLVGVGVDHDQLNKLAEKYFINNIPIWKQKPSLVTSDIPADKSISQYTGGLERAELDLSDIAVGPTQMPDLAHVVLALESSSYLDKQFMTYAVINMLLGGGGSFSAGGPGKGMYTRLYTQVLNCHPWINNCVAYNHAYSDSGIFCIQGSCPPKKIDDLVNVICRQILLLTEPIDSVEFNRAKIQLQSFMMMNLEARPVIFEDIGRQVVAYKHRRSVEETMDMISAVKISDIHSAVESLLRSNISIAARGSLSELQSIETVQKNLNSGLPVKPGNHKKVSWFF